MKRNKRKQKEFLAADIDAVYEGLRNANKGHGYTKNTIRAVARGDRNNKIITETLHTTKEKREKLIARIAKKHSKP